MLAVVLARCRIAAAQSRTTGAIRCDLGLLQERQKSARERLLCRGCDDDGGLLDRRMERRRESRRRCRAARAPAPARATARGCRRRRCPICANCAACEMFSPSTSLRLHALVELLVPQRGHRGAAVRRMLRVGDGDAADARIGQHRQAAPDVDAGIVPRPQHELPVAYSIEAVAFGEPGLLELLRVVDVGGEEDVERRAVLNLREEVAGRAKRQRDLGAGFLLELRGDAPAAPPADRTPPPRSERLRRCPPRRAAAPDSAARQADAGSRFRRQVQPVFY